MTNVALFLLILRVVQLHLLRRYVSIEGDSAPKDPISVDFVQCITANAFDKGQDGGYLSSHPCRTLVFTRNSNDIVVGPRAPRRGDHFNLEVRRLVYS
jgi:hypothetical protein